LEEGEIGGPGRRDDACADRVAAEELDRDLVHGVHDVGRRHDLPVGRDEDPGADLAEDRDAPAAGPDIASLRPDDDDARADLAKEFPDVLGLGRDGADDGRHSEQHDQGDACEGLHDPYSLAGVPVRRTVDLR